MAVALLGTAGKVGEGSATTAGTTLNVTNTTGAIIPAGSLIHIVGVWDNVSATVPTISCSNVGGIGPTLNHATPVGLGHTATAGSGVFHMCFRVVTNANIASGAVICTLTSNQSAVKRGAVAFAASGCTATLRGTVVTATSTSGVPSVVSGGTAPVSGDLVIGSISTENNATANDTDTLNGSWSTQAYIWTTGGSAVTNVAVAVQGKIVTAGGAQTYNPTGAADTVGCLYALVPTPPPTAPTSAPTVGNATAEQISVTTPSSFQGGATSYNVYRGGVQIATGQSTSAVVADTGQDATVSRTYTVRGVNSVGESTDSPASSAIVPGPQYPAFTTLTGNTTIDINITRRAYAAVYKVYRRLTSVGGAYTLVHTSTTQVASGTYTWQDTGLTNGTSYDYVVSTEAQTPTVRESAQSALTASTPVALATLRPVAYVSGSVWSPAGGAATAADALRDAVDTTFVSPSGTQTARYTMNALTAGNRPDQAGVYGISVRGRWNADTSQNGTITVRVYVGGVLKRTFTTSNFTSSTNTTKFSTTYPASELGTGGLSDLEIEVTNNQATTLLNLDVLDIWMQIPTEAAPTYDPEVWDWSISPNAGTDDVTTSPFSVPAGATILICSFNDTGGTGSTRTITDNKGLTWALDDFVDDAGSTGNNEVYVWRAYTASALTGMTVTVTMSQAFSHVVKPVIITGASPTGQPGTTNQVSNTGFTSVTTLTPGTVGSRTFFAVIHEHFADTTPPVPAAGTTLGDGQGGALSAFSWAVGISDTPWSAGAITGVFDWPSMKPYSSIGIEIEPAPVPVPARPRTVLITPNAVSLSRTATR